MHWVAILAGLYLGNFLYHLLTDEDWEEALSWSIAQSIAVLSVILLHPWSG